MNFVSPAIGAIAGIGFATVIVPAVLCTLGFTSAGIAAGSVAAKMMSLSAIANGGGIAAGSLVATAQSLGVTGLSTAAKAAVTATGAAIASVLR
ncbi:interferon alpha-inducible protein 27-like protein 2A [Calonectris borealis]|uniref:interferon alpha-inducible protein 27-like protein 2A n=1 Tax=Calonectris borealis TaxID=1323832 RepID=UPI003F4C3EA7